MKAYSIFDDFPVEAVNILKEKGIETVIHPAGVRRPDDLEIKAIIEEFDIVIIGTSQKMPEWVFENITDPKIIGTASIGMDHVNIPENKRHLIKLINAPAANRISVAEHTFALILAHSKNILESLSIAEKGYNKKKMKSLPVDLYGATIGVVGAGGTATSVLNMARSFGMKCLCWTPHPEKHRDLDFVKFIELENLLQLSDVISINLPLNEGTKKLIDSEKISLLKNDVIFVSLSRTELIDMDALFLKAKENPFFRIALDVDAEKVMGMWEISMNNVIVTPHIAGGTVQSRMRLFEEISENIVLLLNN